MSHVSISKSYAILVGLEAYGNLCKGKKKGKRAAHATADKVLPAGTAEHHRNNKDGLIVKPDTVTDATRKQIKEEEGKREENRVVVRAMKKCKLLWRRCFGLH